MARILLDSTVLIDVLRGGPGAQRLLRLRRDGDVPYVCTVSIEEIWRGLTSSEEASAARLLRALRLAPLARAEGERAGRWRRHLAAQGVTVHQADGLIAAAAVGVGAAVATANIDDFRHFEVELERWPTG